MSEASTSILSLPNETISHIFTFGVLWHRPVSGRLFRASVLLTCRQWRDIAYHTPQLWAYTLWKPPSPDDALENLDVVFQHLSRSGTVPLHLSLDFTTTAISEDHFRALVSMLRPHLHRAQTLRLGCARAGNTLFLNTPTDE